MKKITILAIYLLGIMSVFAQTYTVGSTTFNVTVTATHDSSTCSSTLWTTYIISTDSSFVGDSMVVVDTSSGTLVAYAVNNTGVSPWTDTFSLNAGSRDDFHSVNGLPGTAILWGDFPLLKLRHGADLVYILDTISFYIANPCLYDTVSGWLYIDTGSHCIHGLDVFPYPSIFIQETLFGSVPSTSGFFQSSCSCGTYSYIAQKSWMMSYTVSPPPEWSFIFPLSPCDTSGFARYFTTLPQSNVNFELQCSGSIDLQCDALAPYNIRWGRSFYLSPFTTNTGCDTISGTMTVVLDPRLIYDSSLSVLPADTVRGDTLIWNYYNLSNVAYGTGYWNSFLSSIYLSPDSTVVPGDTLCISGYTQIPSTDIDPLNNSFSFCMPVVNSYDPNVKTVSPAGIGPLGFIAAATDTLTYTIHFQNTGTAPAINVRVVDTLDSHIDKSTFRIIGASANMSPQWLAPGIVEFDFNDIMLPDSGTSWAGSQGELSYKVALNPGLTNGTQIKNTAYIYFDSNPAVVTNTTLNTIDTAIKTKVNIVTKPKDIRIYPNPAYDYVTVENAGDATIMVLDVNGVVVMQQAATGATTTLNVNNLAAGVYVIRTVSGEQATTTRFTKYR